MTVLSSAVDTAGEYRMASARGVADIDRAAWNRVVLDGGGSVFHAWEWLAAFEDAPPGVFEPTHLLVYRGADLVGVCPAYLVHQCPRLDYLASLGGIRLGGPVLLAHSLAAFTGGPIALPGQPGVMAALLDALESRARSLDAWAWGFANISARSLVGGLIIDGYAVSQVGTNYLVDARYDTPGQFWRSLEPRRRRKLERDRRVATAKGFTVHEGMPGADTFVRLAHASLARHDTPADVLPDGFLRALRRHLAPYDRTLATTDADGATVALFGCWEFGSECSVWLAGLDTERLSAFEPYHALMAQAVENAVLRGTPAVNLGRSNGSQKRRYGAAATPLFLALRSADRRRTAQLHAAAMRLEAGLHDGTEGLDVVRRCC